MSDEEYIVYSFWYLPVITKEIATEEEILNKFGTIPDGGFFDDRIVKAIKLTKRNRRKILEEDWDPEIPCLFPDLDGLYPRMYFEWVGRSW